MMMKRIGAWMLLALLTSVGEWCGRCYGCLEEERIGLLEIKALIDPDGFSLGDWVGSSNCCEWPRIECDNTTRRVIQLSLGDARDEIRLGAWVLNASLFLPFKELRSLDLSSNGLVGCFENQGLQVLASGLRNLEGLDLNYNKFNDSILSSLSGFSTLKSLNLSHNSFAGTTGLKGLRNLEILYLEMIDSKESILIESLGALPSLKTLQASGSKFKHFGKGLCNSSSLEEVFLDDSSLPASFLRNMGPLSTLKVLSLTGVDFHSTLPAEGWCELENLEQLSLSGNNLKGVLPPCLGNLSFLQILDLSDNQFEGNIASSHLSHLPQLEYLSITNNYFQVPISFGSLMHPEITDLCSCATLPAELVYEDGNRLALVLYDYVGVATADSRAVDEQQVVCMLERDGLDQQKSYNSGDMKKMGRGNKQKPLRMEQQKGYNSGTSSIGPSFANFITPIADQTELSDLELQRRRPHRNQAKKLSRKAPSVKRRKPRKMGNKFSKNTEIGIIDFSVSDNGIMNRNVIIRSGKEIAVEDEVSSTHSHIYPTAGAQAREPLQPDPREEAIACWDVGKVVLQVHDESHLMTQTLQGFIEKEQEEWMRRKKQ